MSTSSFESPYVSLDLLACLHSGQKPPFHVFNDVVMPEFRNYLSKKKKSLPAQEMDAEDKSSSSDPRVIIEGIQKDLNYIKKACCNLKDWEDLVNKNIRKLILQGLDDAFKERTGEINFIQDNLNSTQKVVSELKNQICSVQQPSSVSLDSESFKRFSTQPSSVSLDSESFKRFSLSQLLAQLPDVNLNNVIAERYRSNTLNFIEVVYNGLDVIKKLCLLCFSVFPENAIIKKKVLVHWWVGEGFIDSLNGGEETAESTGNKFINEFIRKGIIEPVHKKRRPKSDNCKMHPSIRHAVIELSRRAGFVDFTSKGNPTADFSYCRRACLVKTEEGSSLRDLTYGFSLEKKDIYTLFNVSESHLYFRLDWFSKMRYVKVLQLGRWSSSAKQLVEVEDPEFLQGLKKMKHLRYFSLRGISRITELPNSICKLSNLRILNLNGCDNLEKLPDGIGSLTKLTHLDMSECYLISHMPKGLDLLSELQVLKGFVIGNPRAKGLYCGLADLAKLKHLRKLSIHVDTETPRDKKPEVEEELSSLQQFRKLKSLSVAWSRIYNASTSTKETTMQRLKSTKKTTMQRLKSMKETTMQRLKCGVESMRTNAINLAGSQSQPAALDKLGLQYFHGPKMPDWLQPLNLKSLKKLYIRGGELSDLGNQSWTVERLQFKFLSELKMDWQELQALFPKLTYVETVSCPKLSSFPCDKNGVWVSPAADTKQAIIPLYSGI
uniref:Disease resistance RPP13-like protein 4 n=1 Tax=Fagus sylvatica TaxID=28930 RepID=A0A2N9IG86_FAGSY